MLKGLTESAFIEAPVPSGGHMRRASVSFTSRGSVADPEAVSSAWLVSLGHTFIGYVTQEILPAISSLSTAGGSQLASDLEYLMNIVRALNVEHEGLEKWKMYVEMEEDDVRAKLKEKEDADSILADIARLRGLE
jgi:hypothetical protein